MTIPVPTELSVIDGMIAGLNLEALAFSLMTGADGRPRLSDAEANQALDEYRTFIRLVARVDEPIVPTELVDRVWHLHILDSAHYRDMCTRVFGDHLDHWPYVGKVGDADELLDLFEQTQKLALLHFGRAFTGDGADALAASCSHDGCKADLLRRPRPTRAMLVAAT